MIITGAFDKNITMKVHQKNLSGSESGGAAIILVVWVMVILVAIVGEFSNSMRTEINIIRNFKEEQEAYQMALAGIETAKAEILVYGKKPAKVFLNEEGFLLFDEDEEVPERKGELGNGSFEYTITDEESKFNINTFIENQRPKLEMIFSKAGVEYTDVNIIIDSILDWKDKNDLHHFNGAEEDYYSSLDRPYSCKDGDFDSIEELLLVKGMINDIMFGSEGDDEEENEYEGVMKYLTVNGDGKININTASATVLEAVCGTEEANAIISLRENGPTQSRCGKTDSSFFTVVSMGSNQDGTIKRSVKAVLEKNKGKLETVYWRDNVIG